MLSTSQYGASEAIICFTTSPRLVARIFFPANLSAEADGTNKAKNLVRDKKFLFHNDKQEFFQSLSEILLSSRLGATKGLYVGGTKELPIYGWWGAKIIVLV